MPFLRQLDRHTGNMGRCSREWLPILKLRPSSMFAIRYEDKARKTYTPQFTYFYPNISSGSTDLGRQEQSEPWHASVRLGSSSMTLYKNGCRIACFKAMTLSPDSPDPLSFALSQLSLIPMFLKDKIYTAHFCKMGD